MSFILNTGVKERPPRKKFDKQDFYLLLLLFALYCFATFEIIFSKFCIEVFLGNTNTKFDDQLSVCTSKIAPNRAFPLNYSKLQI